MNMNFLDWVPSVGSDFNYVRPTELCRFTNNLSNDFQKKEK